MARSRFLAAVAMLTLLGAASLLPARPVSAAPRATHGILPPHNPSRNIQPSPDYLTAPSCRPARDTTACNDLVLQAMRRARKTLEKMGPLSFSLAAFERLSKDEQLFVVTDMERVSRGLPAIGYLTSSLDAVARVGAVAGGDPAVAAEIGVTLPGGGTVISAGGNWATGYVNPLGSDYAFMYADGRGGGDAVCNQTGVGCWGHRDNILGSYAGPSRCGRRAYHRAMGAGYVVSGGPAGDSETELFVGYCGPPPGDTVISWPAAESLVGFK